MTFEQQANFPSKVALVHDWFKPSLIGGAEQVVNLIDKTLIEAGTEIDYFSVTDAQSKQKASWLYQKQIKTSFIQNLPFARTSPQFYLPLLPIAIEQFDLSPYSLVISSSHLVAKGVLTSPDQFHISYVHTPVRYAWDQMHTYLRHSKLAKGFLAPLLRWQLHQLRQWDQLSSARPQKLIANSTFTSRRIKRFWGRNSEVIHPPVDIDRFAWSEPREDFYLCLSRLVPNKRVDIVVEAFNYLRLPLIVIGDGPEFTPLAKLAGPTVRLLGEQSQTQVNQLLSICRAFVYAGIEDFGIAPVEAMASGAPVIALAKGGLLDTVRCITQGIESPTGLLFKEQTVTSLVEAVQHFEEESLWTKFCSESIHLWTQSFSPQAFTFRFEKALLNAWSSFEKSSSGKLCSF